MYKKIFLTAASAIAVLAMTSCSSQYQVIPQAINTVNSVNLSELRLNHETDYTILNTITADATVKRTSNKKGENVTIEEGNGEFKIEFKRDPKGKSYIIEDFDGIGRFGFLTNDYDPEKIVLTSPEQTARQLAIYRIINAAKVMGADGIIEPIVSTNVEGHGNKRKGEIVFKTTVSAKPVKLNVDAK